MLRRLLTMLLLVAPSARLSAQTRVISGTVADREGNTLVGAEVALVEKDSAFLRATTGNNGRFRLNGAPTTALHLRVRRVGFQTARLAVDPGVRDHSVFIALDPVVLDSVRVTTDEDSTERHLSPGLTEFYARRDQAHMGYFIDEQRMAELRPQYTSEALRTVPGVVVRPARRIGNEVRIRGCAPLIWINGQRAPGAQIDDVTKGTDVAAMEIYVSQTGVPAQYTDRSATCGTILVWMK